MPCALNQRLYVFQANKQRQSKRGRSAPLCPRRPKLHRRITDLLNCPIRNLVSLLIQYHFPSYLGLTYYFRHLRLCGPILQRASWLTILCWIPQAFKQLFVMLHLWWTLRPRPLHQENYPRMCPLVLNRRHLLLLNLL